MTMRESAIKEATLWKWLKKGVEIVGSHRIHLIRVENLVTAGLPDVWGCYNGSSFWIELKTAARPARGSTPVRVKFQAAQPLTIRRMDNAGAAVAVLLQVGRRERYLLDGQCIDWLAGNTMTLDDIEQESETVFDASAQDVLETMRCLR